jgi:hypothetical protein
MTPGILLVAVVALALLAVAGLLGLILREERQQTDCMKTFGSLWVAAPSNERTDPKLTREFAEVWSRCLEIDADELMNVGS